MAGPQAPVSLIRDVPCSSNRIHFSWGLGTEIFCADISSNIDTTSTASCVQWGCMPSGQRRVAYDTLGKYKQLHQQQNNLVAGTPATCAAVADFCNEISGILASCTEAEPVVESLIALQEKALWDLISVFFVDSLSSDGFIAQDLAGWAHENIAALVDIDQNTPLPPSLLSQLQEAPLPEADPEYWPALRRVVALGWITEAIELLGLHSAWLRWDRSGAEPDVQAQVTALEAVTLLLRRFPTFTGHGAGGTAGRQLDTLEEFTTYRKAWQAQCTALLENTDVWNAAAGVSSQTARGLKQIIEQLSGSISVLQSSTTTWLELMISRIVHSNPAIQTLAVVRQVLGDSVAAKQQMMTDRTFLPVLARVIDACCDADAQTAMQACSEVCSDWFMAHISDVFAAHPAGANVLAAELPHLGGNQMEFYTLDYAMALAPHSNTWKLAAEYLAWCPVHGQAGFKALLQRLPLSAIEYQTVLRAGAVCEEHGLSELSKELAKVQGVLSWEHGLFGAAVHWLAQSGDMSRIDAVISTLLVGADQQRNDTLDILQSLPEDSLMTAVAPGAGNAFSSVSLLRIRKLLQQESGKAADGTHNNHAAAISALAMVPADKSAQALEIFNILLNKIDLTSVSEESMLQLLEWLNQSQSQLAAAGLDTRAAQAQLLSLLSASYMMHS